MAIKRLLERGRSRLGLAAIGSLCVVAAAIGVMWLGEGGPAADGPSASATPGYVLTGFTAQRLTKGFAARYGFHFMSPSAPADPGSVDMSTAKDAGGDELRVIVFGRAPAPVRAISCEFVPQRAAGAVPASAAAGFLTDCARIGVGEGQASAAAEWVAQAQAGLSASARATVPANGAEPDRMIRATKFGAVGYAVRWVPGTGEWIISMTGEAS